MLADNSGVVIGEDVLSTYYSTSSSSDSGSTPLSNSTSSASSSMSLSSEDRHQTGLFGFFRRRWFGFGGTAENAKKKHDCDTVDEIMKRFRNNDLAGMEKYIHDKVENSVESGTSETKDYNDETEMWWDDEDFASPKPDVSETKVIPFRKNTPHPKKGITALPNSVLKAVRFHVESTPEDRENRPFTPLFTSTPKQFEVGSDSEDELAPLRECDSNTVVRPIPVLNNTSSILLANCSVMHSLNKCHQETTKALCLPFSKNIYKICYDDTDEEEVPAEDAHTADAPTPSRRTFVVETEDSHPSSRTMSFQDLDQLDSSTDSSVILNLDCIESYIQRLDDIIAAAKRFAREKDMMKAIGAGQQARLLQERLGQMDSAINEMCSKLTGNFEQDNLFEKHEDKRNMSAVFEDSQWRAQFGSEAGSFHLSQH